MSAIAGVFHRDGRPAAHQEAAAMSAALADRGPDGSGIWCGGPVALAQRTLRTTPESWYEMQPLVDELAGLVLVADARLDDRRGLCAVLDLGLEPSLTDADLILRAYRRWGSGCVDRLLGDFAFVVWDIRQGSLFCARDPMGVKPFYYHITGTLFVFASEIKALLRIAEVPRQLDERQLAFYLDWESEDRSGTCYREVLRLPAAQSMTVGATRVQGVTYWRPEDVPEARLGQSGEYPEAFREIFTRAVADRMRSAFPVGATLSGGLDSSSVVCTARGLNERPGGRELQTYSLIFPGLPEQMRRRIDERRFVDSVLAGGRVRPCFVRGDQLSPLAEVSAVLRAVDEPYFAPNLYLHWSIFAAARDTGARVLLDGFDGDTTVSHGLGRLNLLVRGGDWDRFQAEVMAFSARRGIAVETVLRQYGLPYLKALAARGRWALWFTAAAEIARRFRVPWKRLALSCGLQAAEPSGLRQLRRRLRGEASERPLLLPRLAAALQQRTANRISLADESPTDRQTQLQGISQPGYQLTLELADKCAAAHGIEPRYPFFDRRLIEFCLSVPEEERLSNGWTRFVFRRAMEGILPPDVQWRTSKADLSPNFTHALRNADRPRLERLDLTRVLPYVDLEVVDSARRRFLEQDEGGSHRLDGPLLFRIAVLESWLSQAAGSGQEEMRRLWGFSPVAA